MSPGAGCQTTGGLASRARAVKIPVRAVNGQLPTLNHQTRANASEQRFQVFEEFLFRDLLVVREWTGGAPETAASRRLVAEPLVEVVAQQQPSGWNAAGLGLGEELGEVHSPTEIHASEDRAETRN